MVKLTNRIFGGKPEEEYWLRRDSGKVIYVVSTIEREERFEGLNNFRDAFMYSFRCCCNGDIVHFRIEPRK